MQKNYMIFPSWDYLSIFMFPQVTWRTQNGPIGRNKKDLIAAPHFHLSEVRGGGGGGGGEGKWQHMSG